MQKKESLINNIPSLPGVYIMKNAYGEVIYVGKAISLKKRVQSYFTHAHDTKTTLLVSLIDHIDYIITDNEIEALILECNLIKKYRPKYNIELKDDKKYPFIKITAEKYPRVFISREVKKDNALYFGPYTNVKLLRENMGFIREIFPIRMCRTWRGKRACLNYHIKRCSAPCANKISEEGYKKIIEELKMFLEGKSDELVTGLEEKMSKLAENMDYESAALLRDRIKKINTVFEKQKVEIVNKKSEDIISIVSDNAIFCITVFFFRDGKLTGERHFFIHSSINSPSDIMTEFIKQFYSSPGNNVPAGMILSEKINEEDLIKEWLIKKRMGNKVEIIYPERGEKLRRIEMVNRNAMNFLQVEIEKHKRKIQKVSNLPEILKQELNLKKSPLRIEAFDISNLSGTEAVGSMVVFENGEPMKKDYRRFKIKGVSGINDYAMMKEVIKRRYKGSLKEKLPQPDLIVIDGGIGQLNVSRDQLINLDFHPDIISLAKKNEEIYIPGNMFPLQLSKDSISLLYLRQIRDEAHRFAVNYHKLIRSKRVMNKTKYFCR